MAETWTERNERRSGSRRRLQERLHHTIQRAHAALPRYRRIVLVVSLQQLGGEGAKSTWNEEFPLAGESVGVSSASESPSGLSELFQHGDLNGGSRRWWDGGRRGVGWRRRGSRAVSVHSAAEPIQHVPSGAVSGDVVVDSVAALEGEAALVGLRRGVRVGVSGVACRVGTAVGVPVRQRRRRVRPRALRGGARPRRRALVAAADDNARLLVAARAPALRLRTPRPILAPVGLVWLSSHPR